MAGFIRLRSESITAALDGTTRQYLVGDLARPQSLDHVPDKRLEVGLSVYTQSADEEPHRHSDATEFQYMLAGWTQYLDTETGDEHDFFTGDFFVIRPGTTYAQKSRPGTRILFIKVPSINDKHPVPPSPSVQQWYDAPLRSRRIDHWHDEDAPAANSVRPAVAVAILDESDRVLVLRRSDSGNWTMPGGTLEHDESLITCAVREVREETGLDVEIADLVGTYTDPEAKVVYADGEVRREFTIVLFARTPTTDVTLDDESTEFSWVSLDEASRLQLADSQRRRILDVRTFLSTGSRSIS